MYSHIYKISCSLHSWSRIVRLEQIHKSNILNQEFTWYRKILRYSYVSFRIKIFISYNKKLTCSFSSEKRWYMKSNNSSTKFLSFSYEFFEIFYVSKYVIYKNSLCHAFINYLVRYSVLYIAAENCSETGWHRFYLHTNDCSFSHEWLSSFYIQRESLFESLTAKQLIFYFPMSSPSSFFCPSSPPPSLSHTFYLSLSFSLVRAVVKARTLTLIKFISSPWADSRTLSSSNFSAFLSHGTRLHSLLRIYLSLLGKGKGRKTIILELLAHCYYGNRV